MIAVNAIGVRIAVGGAVDRRQALLLLAAAASDRARISARVAGVTLGASAARREEDRGEPHCHWDDPSAQPTRRDLILAAGVGRGGINKDGTRLAQQESRAQVGQKARHGSKSEQTCEQVRACVCACARVCVCACVSVCVFVVHVCVYRRMATRV